MTDSRAADIVGDFFDSDEWGDLEADPDLESGEPARHLGGDTVAGEDQPSL